MIVALIIFACSQLPAASSAPETVGIVREQAPIKRRVWL